MGKCRFCKKKGLFFKVDENGLCDKCLLQYAIAVKESSRIISESIKIVDKTKNKETKLKRCLAIIEHCERLLKYENMGLEMFDPLPSKLLARSREIYNSTISEASNIPIFIKDSFNLINMNAELKVKYRYYLKKGSLLRHTISHITCLPPEMQPIHIRFLENTEKHLQASLESGESYEEISSRLAKEVYGIDYYHGQIHPALPNPNTGIIPDPNYGKLPGYAKPDDPVGVMGDIKTLYRTETSYAYNSSQYDELRGIEGCTGYMILASNIACKEICIPIIQALNNKIYFKDIDSGKVQAIIKSILPENLNYNDGFPPFHPNCYCDIGQMLFDSPENPAPEFVKVPMDTSKKNYEW